MPCRTALLCFLLRLKSVVQILLIIFFSAILHIRIDGFISFSLSSWICPLQWTSCHRPFYWLLKNVVQFNRKAQMPFKEVLFMQGDENKSCETTPSYTLNNSKTRNHSKIKRFLLTRCQNNERLFLWNEKPFHCRTTLNGLVHSVGNRFVCCWREIFKGKYEGNLYTSNLLVNKEALPNTQTSLRIENGQVM